MSANQSGTNTASGGQPAENLSSMPSRRRGPIMSGTGVAIVVGVAVIAVIAGFVAGYYTAPSKSSSTSVVTISETGSSLLWPMLLNWSADYLAVNPNVHLTVAATGSGTGQAESICGVVNMGASDTFIKNASSATCSSGAGKGTYVMAQVPTAISASLIWVNFPTSGACAGFSSGQLNINGTMLGEIYNGNITTWDNPLIFDAQSASVQTCISSFSSQTIIPVARSDSSGDTGLFTAYITMSWAGWVKYGHAQGNAEISGTKGTNLNSNFVTADLNSGVLSTIESTEFSIGYVGISYEHLASGVEYAALGDNESLSAAGGLVASNYMQPNATDLGYDANLGLLGLNYGTYGLAVNLILGGSPTAGPVTYPSGAGGRNPTSTYPTPYPVVNLEYTLVRTMGTPTAGNPGGYATAEAIVAFYYWVLSYGQSSAIVGSVGFLPLTPEVLGYAMETVATIVTS